VYKQTSIYNVVLSSLAKCVVNRYGEAEASILLKTMEASRNVLFVFGNIFGQNSKEMGD
jgi:hypothetical protein